MVTENLIQIGILVILLGFALVIIGSFLSASKGKVEGAFVGFIGAIPIGFATSERMLYVGIIVSLILLVIFLLPYLRGFI